MSAIGAARRHAAVLVPVFRDAHAGLRVVLIRRTEGGRHGGQLAFPGGNVEPGDATPFATALREAEEEIGLQPAHVMRLADLPVLETRSTGYRIEPFLARVTRPDAWRLAAREVAEVLEPRIRDLLGADARGEALEHWDGRPVRIEFIRVGDHRLWGASHRILEPLLARLDAGEWEI